jgi:hypothetical protein
MSSFQFLNRIIAIQNATLIGWNKLFSSSSSLSTFTIAVLISVIDVFLFLIFAAKIIDSIASEKLRIGLEEDEDLKVLHRIEKLKGQKFVIDKELDWIEPVYDNERETNDDDNDTTSSRISLLSYIFPIREVCLIAKSPSFGLLDRDTHASHDEAIQANQIQVILSRFDEICGPTATTFKRMWILRGVIFRYLLLKLYFDLSWISPFTRYDQCRSRASRLTLKLGLLATSFWATMAFYSFKSNSVGVVADSNSLSFQDLIVYNVLAVIFQQLILVLLTQLITSASEISFRYRFPFVYAEMRRRQASELRFSAMTPEELEEALREAQALQDAATASLKNKMNIEQATSKESLSHIETIAEEHLSSTEARLIAAEEEAEMKAEAAAKKKMSPLLAKAAHSLLTQRPSPADLLIAAATPLLKSSPKVSIEEIERQESAMSLVDKLNVVDKVEIDTGHQKGGNEYETNTSSIVETDSTRLVIRDDESTSTTNGDKSKPNPLIKQDTPPSPLIISDRSSSHQCCSTCCSRLHLSFCGCKCFRRYALKNATNAVDAVRAAQKRAAKIAIDAEAKASKLFEQAEREAYLFFIKRGSSNLIPFFLQFLVFIIFSFFVLYWVLFSLAQGDVIIIEESSNWLYWTIVLGPLIPEPCLFLFSILNQLVLWPVWQPYLSSLPGSIGRMFQSNDVDVNTVNRKKKGKRGVGGESLTRASGLASSFPPALAALAFAVTAAASTAVTAASNTVVNVATTSVEETAADEISNAEEDAKRIAEEEEKNDEEEKVKKQNDDESKKEEAKKNEKANQSISETNVVIPAVPTERSKTKPKSTLKKFNPKAVLTPKMRELLIVKAPAVIKVQAAEIVADKIASESMTVEDLEKKEIKRREKEEKEREKVEIKLMKVEDKDSKIAEDARKAFEETRRRHEKEERQLADRTLNATALEKERRKEEEVNRILQHKKEQERIRLLEETARRLKEEEIETLIRLQEEEKEQEKRIVEDEREQLKLQEEMERREEESRIQSQKERELLEAQLKLEDEEATKGLVGEISRGDDELVDDDGSGVDDGEGDEGEGGRGKKLSSSSNGMRRGDSFQDFT